MYSLYLYFLGLSLRNTSKALIIFKDEKRSDVSVWNWIQRIGSWQIYKRKNKCFHNRWNYTLYLTRNFRREISFDVFVWYQTCNKFIIKIRGKNIIYINKLIKFKNVHTFLTEIGLIDHNKNIFNAKWIDEVNLKKYSRIKQFKQISS